MWGTALKTRIDYLFTAALIWALAALLGLALAAIAYSASVRLAWDHDGAEGYRLYLAEFGQPIIQVWQGPEKTTSIQLAEGVQYWCAVTAYNGTLESAQSDILQFIVPTTQGTIIVPGRPSAIRIEFQ